MEALKIRLKVGEHEFDGEGPADIIQSQVAAWKEMIASVPAKKETTALKNPDKTKDEASDLAYNKIFKVEGRLVSLTARAETVGETALLILLGQKVLRENQEVTGAEIIDGLRQSGYALARADVVMNKLSADGNVITVGVGRSRRYRLSNSGLNVAVELAKAVISTVP